MVIVQPSDFIGTHQRVFDAPCIDRAQGERFKFEKLGEGVALSRGGRHIHHQVLNAHAPLPGPVNTRLDGSDHAHLHGHVWLGHGLADALRPFVHVQEVAHTVAGAMAKINALGPQRRTCQRIEHGAQGAQRKARARQSHGAFEHQGVVTLHGRTHRADGPDACDVGGAAEVLATGIDEQQTIALDHCVRFSRGAVMRHGAIGIEAGDGGKTQTRKTLALGARGREFFVDGQFGDRLLTQGCFKPGVELTHGRAVFGHGFAHKCGVFCALAAFQ